MIWIWLISRTKSFRDQINNLWDLESILFKKYVDGEILLVGCVYDIRTESVEFLQETLLHLHQPKLKSD